jgi:D-alanyl-D-alanine carboxypeptidase
MFAAFAKSSWVVALCPVILVGLIYGCQPSPLKSNPLSTKPVEVAAVISTRSPAATARAKQDVGEPVLAPASPTLIPTTTHTPTPWVTATPRATPTTAPTATATPIGACELRLPDDGLLTILTLEYGISRDYVPADLIPLSDYLPNSVTLGYPTEIRHIVLESLIKLIDDMHTDGLEPTIISGYRSYAAQAIAWSKWLVREPDRAAILSAPPGHSEHQLGTTLDFGSPELAGIVDEEEIEFHTYFYMTSESMWLAENAHSYGFTLSFPRQAFELTGFYYEPWHYRYVGIELATRLKDEGSFLTQYQFESQPIPCIP